jgi:glucan phosphorylase
MHGKPTILEVAMEIALPHEFLERVAARFGPDKARDCAMSTSVGGIGPLLRERIVAQAEAGIDVVGVTLMYDAVWVQTWHEWGQITLQKRDLGRQIREIMTKTDLGFPLTMFDGTTVDVEVWQTSYGRATVYFLSAPKITEVVYPGPKDMPAGSSNAYAWAHDIRLKHSWLVGRGALALLKKLGRRIDIGVLSETPTIFAHNRLVKDEFQQDPFFADTRYIFNDHTPLEYAHPIWDQSTIDTVKIDPAVYLPTPAWNGHKKTLDVTSLLVSGCEGVYGVARKHGEVMRAMPSLREFAGKIKYVTNGVSRADWQSKELNEWENLSDDTLADIRRRHKMRLLDWTWRHCRLWPTWAKENENMRVALWTRRITPYKRLDLVAKMLRNAEWRERFLQLNVVLLVGGRIHQQDNHAQDIVYDLLEMLNNDEVLQRRVVPIDNFNIWEAPILYRGADAAVMIADDTREASATGFMKAQMNGAAILATADGAVPEFVRFFPKGRPGTIPAEDRVSVNGLPDHPNGFQIPYVNGEPTPLGFLEALEQFDAAYRDPALVSAVTRSALSVTANVDVARTTREMQALYGQVLTLPRSFSEPIKTE